MPIATPVTMKPCARRRQRRRACIVQVTCLVRLAAVCLLAACHRPGAIGAATAPAAEVRAARAIFNEAIARHDSAAIAPLLLESYHIVTGRSAQTHGRAAALATWGALFRGDSTLRYVRATREVRANTDWGLAEELGDWTGHFLAPDGLVRVSGRYAAKWQRAPNGRWLLQSEVFTTLACDGGPKGCVPPDPVAAP